ncbi:hypothetical protein [Methyloversatilis sp.]|uniref:hypothetical protein n=1 Tax=Methyloversatilis sp. TaxID=2569862 RepID=UPI002732C797|nr:hypothetical protein [Methyloversatilis sp.]MDP2869150.1 hypothetical protein [Methyloversatilis sp.]MDP3457187.1 hypothetical protein [Methyloversatilis sp.]MDP3576579.1 hypothetical protein [Methyloversatilis sp.]
MAIHSTSTPFQRRAALAALIGGLALAPATHAASYTFDVLYEGAGVAALAAGSDDPESTVLYDGDTFVWTLSIVDDRYWEVVASGDFFPLMAFGVSEAGDRTVNYMLTLYNDAAEVFSDAAADVVNSSVHLGTNTITLDAGLKFDSMRLELTLISATEDDDPSLATATSPYGLLPIFGAPEQNTFYPGIVLAPVPEPQPWALAIAGLITLGALSRRRR